MNEPDVRVLVVDDDRLIRTAVSDELSGAGFEVMQATDGQEALAILQAEDFDVIVCDVRMPRVDGLSLLSRVQELYHGTEVIILTGFADLELSLQVLRLGAFDLVRKDEELQRLLPTVRRAVERRHLREMRSLHSISSLIFAYEKRHDLPQRIVEVAVRVMGADDASLMLPDNNGRLYIAYSSALPEQVTGTVRINLGERVAGRAAQERKPMLLHGKLGQDPRFAGVEEGDQRRLMSSIVYPLYSGDHLHGVLNLNRVKHEQRPFRQRDLERASILAAQIVMGLEIQHLMRQVTAADKFRSIGQLAASVTHEINNPVTYVISNIEYVGEALQRLPGLDGISDLQGALQDALAGAQRIRDVVRDLRNMTRATTHSRVPMVLRDAVQAALRITAAELHPAAAIDIQVPADLTVIGNRNTISQVFVNLFLNAAHALTASKQANGRLRVSAQAEGEWAVVEVSDNGSGVPQQVLVRVFEPFFTTKAPGEGTGLGLSICQEIVNWHGGTMAVTSHEDTGTTFRFTLPLTSADEVEAHTQRGGTVASAQEPVASQRPRVLAIDDEEALCRAYHRTLKGCDVISAHNGEEALRVIEEDAAFAVVLCDVLMPELSGVGLYERVRQEHPELARRFVFVTGSAGRRELQRIVLQDDVPVLEKPVPSSMLQEVVADYQRRFG